MKMHRHHMSLGILICLALKAFDPLRAAELDVPTAAFLKQHCVRCHGEKKVEGDLRLDQLGADLADCAFVGASIAA